MTAHDAHAVRAFEVHAAAYLLKPVTAARLAEGVRRAVERARIQSPAENSGALDDLLASISETPVAGARIPVRGAEGTTLVPVAEILWAEADGDHVRLHMGAAVQALRETMAGLKARLAPFRFVRVHRSAIVNSAAIRRVESIPKGDFCIVMPDGARVRTGRRYRAAVQKLLR